MLILKTFTEKECYNDKNNICQTLEKLRINSLIYQDSEGKYFRELAKAISVWNDQKYKTKAINLMKELRRSNRFQKSPSLLYAHIDSTENILNALYDLNIDAIILIDKVEKITKKKEGMEIINLEDFIVSEYNKKIEEYEEIRIKKDLRKEKEFKDKVLRPILSNTKNSIEIYDRFIGRNVVKQNKEEVEISNNYRSTIELIINSFLEFTDCEKLRKFKLMTGIKNKYHLEKMDEIRKCFRDLMHPYKGRKNFEYRVQIKDETGENELEHDRYLFSNVFDYKFEEGFGFIHKNGISNFTISHIKKIKANTVLNEATNMGILIDIDSNKDN